MNEVLGEVDCFMSFSQVDTKIFDGRGQACPDSQSNCGILRCTALNFHMYKDH